MSLARYPCAAKGCKDKAEYDSPAKLCKHHWMMWWYCNIDNADEALKVVLSGKELSFTMDIKERVKQLEK